MYKYISPTKKKTSHYDEPTKYKWISACKMCAEVLFNYGSLIEWVVCTAGIANVRPQRYVHTFVCAYRLECHHLTFPTTIEYTVHVYIHTLACSGHEYMYMYMQTPTCTCTHINIPCTCTPVPLQMIYTFVLTLTCKSKFCCH